MIKQSVAFTLLLAIFVQAQTCENYGVLNGTNCACPVGFGGSTCSQPGCGGTIFQGSQRPLVTSTGSLANLTAAGCSCESGWMGTGCNVCQSASACQTAFSAVGSVSASAAVDNLGNETMVCNSEARVFASSQMSCLVNVSVSSLRFPFYLNKSKTSTVIRIQHCKLFSPCLLH